VEGELSGKTALITGASQGIGAATAIALAASGVRRFFLQYNRNRDGMDRVLEKVRALGGDAHVIAVDLATHDGIERLLTEFHQFGQPIDILVNNAGSLVQRARLAEFTEDLYDRVMNLNVKSVWLLTQAVIPAMIQRRSGFIINVSSIAARNGGGPGATVYAGAKAAISAMTKGMAKELAPHNIRVNAVSPGTVDNYFHEQFSTRDMLETVIKGTPAGRLGTNEDIADVIVFLCSPGSRYIYGQTIEVNGGGFMI